MFTTTVTPRFGDIDALGHINNTVLPVWFELARNPFFRMFQPDLKIELKTWSLIMAHIDFDFLHELTIQYDVEIRSSVSRIGSKSFTLVHEAWQNGKLCSKGEAVLVHYDFNTKQTTLIPEHIKQQLAEHLVS
ncbi:MAG: acyl-CoA thioesterase [Prevotellaceae bacterium]|jgi:acyl-CoA thioester hydrolase|nr:acyl-CoA thioesterase [Prevotellaceae bacterium]